MNEGAAKAARCAARAHGLMPAYRPGLRASGARPAWKLPRAVARNYEALSHRARGRQRAAWARAAWAATP